MVEGVRDTVVEGVRDTVVEGVRDTVVEGVRVTVIEGEVRTLWLKLVRVRRICGSVIGGVRVMVKCG